MDHYPDEVDTQNFENEASPMIMTRMTLGAKLGGRALTIAVVLHLLVITLGFFWIFQIIREPEVLVDFLPPGGGGGERSADHAVKEKQKKQIVPVSKAKRVVAEGARAQFTIPDLSNQFGELSPLSSMGSGGNGKLFGLVPPSMSKRCDKAERLKRIAENGGTPACEDAAKYLLANTTFSYKNKANLYGHYHESQAMMQRGGDEWENYNSLFRDQLPSNQAGDGSWKPNGCPHVGSEIFSTTLCTLMLEVSYRFLKTSGGESSNMDKL
jgi:hypothetical protein